jgi:hypothetical protein
LLFVLESAAPLLAMLLKRLTSIELIHLPAVLHFVELMVTGKPNFLWRASLSGEPIFSLFRQSGATQPVAAALAAQHGSGSL